MPGVCWWYNCEHSSVTGVSVEDGGIDYMADGLVSRVDELSTRTQREIGKKQKHSKLFLPAFQATAAHS